MITDSRELKSYHVIIGVDQGYGNIKTANAVRVGRKKPIRVGRKEPISVGRKKPQIVG